MKLTKIACLSIILVFSLGTAVWANDIFAVKTALTSATSQKSCDISVLTGEVLEFSASDLELRMGLKPQTLTGITVTSLPKKSQGELVLDGVNVNMFEFISRDEVDKLCFVPREETVAASMTFIPRAKDSSTTELAISVLAHPNLAPEIQTNSYETVKNVAISGYIAASDPDGDEMRVQVIKQPSNGTVKFDGLAFTYTPYKDVSGRDSFTICAIDVCNNYSTEANVSIDIEKPKDAFYYADMTNNPSAFAAIKLREKGVISGRVIGEKHFFAPDDLTTRGEFFVMLIAAGGFEDSLTPTVNTGLPNDAEIPSWLKPYVKKAIDEDIWSATQAFVHNEIPTRAEAVVLVDRASKINDVKDFSLQLNDRYSIPEWALKSYKDLAAYKMLDLHDNKAHPFAGITNSYSADLLWQLWKHCNR